MKKNRKPVGPPVILRQVLLGLAIACVLLTLAEFTYVNKHPHVRWEKWFNFYGFFALLGTGILLGVAKLFKPMLAADPEDGP